MASNTSAVYARVDTKLKNEAEKILARLGISASTAIQMLYSQVVLRRGLPFDLHLPPEKPLSAGSLTEEQLDEEILKGIKSAEEGPLISEKEIDEEININNLK